MEPISILVIDDEPMICKGCRMVLSDKGHTVGTCMSGKLGLDAIRKELFDDSEVALFELGIRVRASNDASETAYSSRYDRIVQRSVGRAILAAEEMKDRFG